MPCSSQSLHECSYACQQQLHRDRREDEAHQPLERLDRGLAHPALQPLAHKERNRRKRHRDRERCGPHAELVGLAGGEQHHGSERRGPGDERNGERHDIGLAIRLRAKGTLRMGKNHANRNHKKDNTASNRQRSLRKVHCPQDALPAQHEGHEDREGDQAFAQDDAPAPLAVHLREHGVHDRDTAKRIDDEREQDHRREKFVRHSCPFSAPAESRVRYDIRLMNRVSAPAAPAPVSTAAFLCLLAGGCAIAFAPILVRLSDTGPVASAFWRCALAAPVLCAWALYARGARSAPIPAVTLIAAGLFFAADLGVWHWSIVYTSVANSTLLANLAPIFVTLAGWLLWPQAVTRTFLAGMVLALAGMFILVGPHFASGGTRLLGA